MKKNKLGVLAIIMMVIGVLIYSKRKPREYFHFKGELWADQAGYYMYLPGAFIYDFDGSEMPDTLLKSIGHGFHVDTTSGKMITKYAVGVAMLQAPFFGLVHLHTKITGGRIDGFSGNYHNVPNWAAWFYASIGLLLFYLFLIERVQRKIAWVIISVIFFGTSTYYYGVDNTGMSHIYSFFLFSAFIYVFNRVCRNGLNWINLVAVGAISGLIVAVRPINLLFIPMAVFYLLFLYKRDWHWAKRQLSISKIMVGITMAVLMLVPQFLYWKYTSGSAIHYSYGNEGFSNWKSPMLIEFWFAPLAGLFLYSPAYLLAIGAIFRKIKQRENQVLIIGFLGFCYLMASWHVYFFGCSFGSRNLVEFSVLFFIPLALWLNELKRVKLMRGLLITSMMFTLSLAHSFGGCYTFGVWNWKEFVGMGTRGVHYQSISNKEVLPNQMFLGINSDAHRFFTISNYHAADVCLKVEGYGPKTELAFEVYKDSVLAFASFNVAKEMERDGGNEANYTFLLPKDYPKDASIKAYLFNVGQDTLKLEKLSIWLR
ncbi:hypothetical protein [Owenweeksia hongkongensis]|uniref:hypothetical protein n=1 Tax=Owenweeksia hongkongensis TaxID=253245 RepID=UPI003A93EFB4